MRLLGGLIVLVQLREVAQTVVKVGLQLAVTVEERVAEGFREVVLLLRKREFLGEIVSYSLSFAISKIIVINQNLPVNAQQNFGGVVDFDILARVVLSGRKAPPHVHSNRTLGRVVQVFCEFGKHIYYFLFQDH